MECSSTFTVGKLFQVLCIEVTWSFAWLSRSIMTTRVSCSTKVDSYNPSSTTSFFMESPIWGESTKSIDFTNFLCNRFLNILKKNERMEVNLLVNILIAIIHALAQYSFLSFLHNIRYQQTNNLSSMWMNSNTLKIGDWYFHTFLARFTHFCRSDCRDIEALVI